MYEAPYPYLAVVSNLMP